MRTLQVCLCVGLFASLPGCDDALLEPDSGVALLEAEDDWSSLNKGAGGVNGDVDYCVSWNPCVSGEGDCDLDIQCAAGLVCGLDNGDRFGFSGGTDVCVIASCDNRVQDGLETGIDCGTAECGVCTDPCLDVDPVNGSAGHCSDLCPCPAGHGDCDSDLQCVVGLYCATDVGPQYGFVIGTDVCEGTTCTNGVLDGDELGVDCGGSCSSCDQPVGWADAVGNASANVVMKIAVDEVDGAVYVAGQFTGTLDSGVGNLVSAGSLDFYVIKYSVAGTPLWAKSYGGVNADGDVAVGLSVDPVTRRLAIGANYQGTDDFGGGNITAVAGYDAIVIVLDSAGNYVNAMSFGGAGTDRMNDVRFDRLGNLYAAASFGATINFGGATLTSAGNFDGAAVKFNSSFAHLWSMRFGGTGADEALDIAPDRDGNPTVVGAFSATSTFGATPLVSAGLTDMFVLKLLGATGGVSWVKGYGSTGLDKINSVATDKNRNIYAVGGFKKSIDFGGGLVTAAGVSDKLDGFVLALTSTGGFRWVRTAGSTDHDSFTGVAVDVDSTDLAVVGNFRLTLAGFDETGADVVSAGGGDALVWTVDSATGNTQAVQRYGSAGEDSAKSVARDSASVEILGTFNSTMNVGAIPLTSAGSTDAWVAHYATF